jgi:CheY-like chemotaxis protein
MVPRDQSLYGETLTPMAKILCVDDEPNVVKMKCAILEAAGHDVTPATSAHEALDKLKHASYDAVVTDWRLGDANGRAVVEAANDQLRLSAKRKAPRDAGLFDWLWT